jgi:hypothetical protein
MSLTDHLVIIYLTIFFHFTGSRIQAFIFQVLRSPLCTQRSMIYIMTIRLVVGTEPLSISFLLHTSPTDHFATLSLFFIIHNRGFAGSSGWRVHEKLHIQNCSSSIPAIFMLFPICIKYGLMLITDHAGSENIVINSEGLEEISH